ncbi:MAG: peptide deformylase [Opitutaceae bacterium]|jgi:peptide deformylase|nr:peptide deformylase [Opitutaceae bacterium]
MTLAIVHYNTPVLRQKGAPVTAFDADLLKLTSDMVATMHAARGIGLAAQQIGRALQLCVIDLRETDRDFSWELDGAQPPLELIMPMVLANPKVEVLPSAKTLYEEGCLSFPEIRGDVARPDLIRVTFQDAQGTPHTLTCNGLFGRCIQHEVDHLNGTLFIDRMDKATRRPIERAITALAAMTKAAAG